jgi:subtilisin family serine protease
MKKTVFTALLLFVVVTLTAQNNAFYYYKGKQKPISIDKSKVNVFITNLFQKSSVAYLTSKDFEFKEQPNNQEKWATIDFGSQLNDSDFLQKINSLRSNPEVIGIGYHYKAKEVQTVGSSNVFYVKLKSINDLTFLQEFAATKNVIVLNPLDLNSGWYALKTTRNTILTAVEQANQFFETGRFEEIDPAFMMPAVIDDNVSNNFVNTSTSITSSCAGDPEFGLQWGLYNSNNPAIDINACEAWAIPGANGNGIKVAVLDTGIKLNHPDLAANIYPQSYDSNLQSQPSNLSVAWGYGSYLDNNNVLTQYKSNHGTHVAGIIGALGNGRNTKGVAPNCKIIGISNKLTGLGNESISLADGINWAFEKTSDIINNSWKFNRYNELTEGTFNSSYLENRIINALDNGREGKGTIVVFAAGNNYGSTNYPAYIDPRIMVVGAIDQNGQRADFSSYYTEEEGYEQNNVDVVAPGVDIQSLIINEIPGENTNTTSIDTSPSIIPPTSNQETGSMGGTSMAAPFVSGTAALILSVNPCATGKQVRDYIESTCQKVGGYDYQIAPDRPNGTRNEEMGYGLIDAYGAVKMAKEGYSSTYDLYIKDFYDDSGKEPYITSGFATNSPDIWIRNEDDNIDFDQPAIALKTNFVYVRVRNKSCVDTPLNSSGSNYQRLDLYVSKPSVSDPDPTSRYSPLANENYVLSGSQSIPAIAAGEEVILKFPFFGPLTWLPTPGGAQINVNLMARIESNIDPMAAPLSHIAYNNTVKNNNIASKNGIQVYYDYLGSNGGHYPERVSVSNPFDEAHSFRLELVKEDTEPGKSIYEEAEVMVTMDAVLYSAWQRGGKVEQNLKETVDERKLMVENNHVLIDNIQLNAFEEGYVTVDFSFLTKEVTDKQNFKYYLILRDLVTNEIVGVETYNITKKPRPVFEADAGEDKLKDRNETITITARQISEPAIYNWYDTDGNLIFQGQDLTVANDVAKNYKLEVIATADGFKDYSEVEVKLKPSVLSVIAPNPATENVTISYKINEGGSAYLMVLGEYCSTNASNNYIVNPELGEVNINLANYSNGFYTVALVVNGHIIDAKTLVIE